MDEAGKYAKEEVWAHYYEKFPIIEEPVCYVDNKIGNFLIPADDEGATKKKERKDENA